MRYLTARCPDIRRVLLVESGSRTVLDAAIPKLRGSFGAAIALDLFTCFPGVPRSLGPATRIWRTQDHATSPAKRNLVREITATGATVVAIVCSGESIMARWKWWLAWKINAKVLIVNENGDCFWLDTAHLRTLRHMILVRLGLSGTAAGRTVARLAFLPFVFFYLLLYASVVHARRAFRLAFKA